MIYIFLLSALLMLCIAIENPAKGKLLKYLRKPTIFATVVELFLLGFVGIYQINAGCPRAFGDCYEQQVIGNFEIFKLIVLATSIVLVPLLLIIIYVKIKSNNGVETKKL